jgi:hypothetical protein
MTPAFLTAARNTRMAYDTATGEGTGVVFCCGYRSDMHSTKATALAEWCAAHNVPFTRFDYFAHGKSEGDFNILRMENLKAISRNLPSAARWRMRWRFWIR